MECCLKFNNMSKTVTVTFVFLFFVITKMVIFLGIFLIAIATKDATSSVITYSLIKQSEKSKHRHLSQLFCTASVSLLKS